MTWLPEVISVDLHEVGAELCDLTLILASDGIWDLWLFEEAFDAIMRPAGPGPSRTQPGEEVDTFFQESLKRGVDTFGDDADNMTGIVVYFSDSSGGGSTAKPAPTTPSSRQAL